jgi:hypothetical protein
MLSNLISWSMNIQQTKESLKKKYIGLNAIARSSLALGVGIAMVGLTAGPAFADTTPNSVDTNGDGLISTVEAAPFYGGIQATLTTSGDTSAASAVDFATAPVADASGNLTYSRTFTVSDALAQAIMANQVVLVQHGIDINGDGTYDGVATSSVDASLPLESTIPATCGVIEMTSSTTASAHLGSVNGAVSQATGNATISLDGDNVTVNISSQGLSPNLPHLQHFHLGGTNMCPPVLTNTSMIGTGTTTGSTGTTTGSTGTVTASSTTNQSLSMQFTQIQAAITSLQTLLNSIEANLTSFLASTGGSSTGTGSMGTGTTGSGSGTVTGTTTTSLNTGVISQNGQTVNAGGQIDFGGSNFGKEEHVNITLNGAQVGSGFTNSTGGFSTGSMQLPTTPGTYSYIFTGQTSGITSTATLTVK